MKEISAQVEKLVRQRLVWAVNDLRHTAAVWQGAADSQDRLNYMEAANEIEKIARDYR